MSWIVRQHSKGEIDRAGEALIALPQGDSAREHAIKVVDNFRACHYYPLLAIKMTLRNRAKKVDPEALVAHRLKRRPSIELKLRHNQNMKLSQMQDIAGCRAVLRTIDQVRKLVKNYKDYHQKNSKDRSSWDGSDSSDYIEHPKPDGYRSVHLIFKYNSSSPTQKPFIGQRVEIQIRSRLQHLWATAVETAQVFTGQALKSRIKKANNDWLRFFALTSSVFALREKAPLVPGTPQTLSDLREELLEIDNRTDIMEILKGWNDTIRTLENNAVTNAVAYLLVLNPSQHTLTVTAFRKEEESLAQKAYEQQEKRTETDPSIQVVLVSVESLDSLRMAYPNYYVDTREFLTEIQTAIKI